MRYWVNRRTAILLWVAMAIFVAVVSVAHAIFFYNPTWPFEHRVMQAAASLLVSVVMLIAAVQVILYYSVPPQLRFLRRIESAIASLMYLYGGHGWFVLPLNEIYFRSEKVGAIVNMSSSIEATCISFLVGAPCLVAVGYIASKKG